MGGHAPSGPGMSLDPVRLLKKYYGLLLGAAVVGAVLGVASHFILAKTYPQFTSATTFAVTPPQRDPTVSVAEAMTQDELLRFMGTQMAIMMSTSTLDKVLDDADVLATSWAQDYYYRGSFQKQNAEPDLEKLLSVRQVPQTNLIRLSMTYRNPDDAYAIVRTIAKIYLDDIRSAGSERSVRQREVLGKQVAFNLGLIKDLTDTRDRLLQANDVTDINAGVAQEDEKTRELSQRYVTTVSSIAAVASQYERYRKMQEESSIVQFPDNIRDTAGKDPVVQTLDQQVANYRTDYSTLRNQGFGEEHPTVVSVKMRIAAVNQERQETFERTLRKVFDAEVDMLRGQLDAMRATEAQIKEEFKIVDKRKQDLTRLRIRLQDIENEVKAKTEETSRLQASLKQLELLGDPIFTRVQEVVRAQKPQIMSFPQLKILIPLGTVLLLGLTAGLVVLREVLDQRVRGPADLATMARIRVLGLVADAQEDPTRPSNLATAFRDAPTGVTAESFRLLRAPVIKGMDQAGHKTLLVLAGMPESGATTVATNLGLACAGADERVLIIDANLRRPGVQKAFGLPDAIGLGDVLNGAAKLDEAVRPTSADNLFVLTGGSAANRAMPERLASEAMSRLLAEAKGKFDRVIIDSAPAIVSGDGFTLANRVDAVALVVRAMVEKRGLVARLRAQFGECRGEFLGVVVNAVQASAGGYLRGNIKASHEYQHGSQAA
ncbi:MAG TPA: hypothetical protein PKE29_11795 [Phycisphaerales bacterium]|nr:hypothetical protein [Phycisphaerales bacterium]